MSKSLNPGINKFFLGRRKLFINGEINNDLSINLIKEIQYLSSKSKDKIQIIIDSPGGYLNETISIIDEIESCKLSKIIINTIVSGTAFSAAASILAAGTKGYRWGRPNSIIMLHPCSYELNDEDSNKQEKTIEFVNKRIDYFNRDLAKNCNINDERKYQKFLKDIANNKFLTAKEAVKYGILDKVVNNFD